MHTNGSQPIDRRSLLVAGCALALRPWPIAGQEPVIRGKVLEVLKLRERRNRPLLILIRPEGNSPAPAAWEALLEASTPKDLLPLLAAYTTCMSLPTVRKSLPNKTIPTGTWAVLVEHGTWILPADQVQVVQAKVGPIPSATELEGMGETTRRKALRDPILPLLAALTRAMEPTAATLEHRGKANLQMLPAGPAERIQVHLKKGDLTNTPVPLADSGAYVRWVLETAPADQREAVMGQVRDQVIRGLRLPLVYFGVIEPSDTELDVHGLGPGCPLCGIGYVDARQRQFLDHYSNPA